MKARACGVSFIITAASPPPTTIDGESPTDGNGNWLKSTVALAGTVATPGTKSPSGIMAAAGGCLNTLLTDCSNVTLVAEPFTSLGSSTLAMSVSACLTVGSVHGMPCTLSESYLSGPAWRM